MSAWLYTGLLLFVGLERLWELWLSRRNLARLRARGAVEVGQGHFRVMVVLHTAFLFACVGEVWLFGRGFLPAVGWPALALALTAQGLRYWAVLSLGERWNTRVVVLPGEAPVVRGPYRFIRHPNYVAVVLELLVLPLVHSAWLTSLLFSFANGLLLRVRIRAEEKALGEAYEKAFDATPRFLPGA